MNSSQKKRAKKGRAIIIALGLLTIGFACVYLLFPHTLTNASLSVTPDAVRNVTFPTRDIIARHKDVVKYREAFFVIGVGILIILFSRKLCANRTPREEDEEPRK